jgi:hypothetical protein
MIDTGSPVITIIASAAVCGLVIAGVRMPNWNNAIFAGAAGVWAFAALLANRAADDWKEAADRWETVAGHATEYAANLAARPPGE